MCSRESGLLQKKHSSSGLILYLLSSFLVTSILWSKLKENFPNLLSFCLNLVFFIPSVYPSHVAHSEDAGLPKSFPMVSKVFKSTVNNLLFFCANTGFYIYFPYRS